MLKNDYKIFYSLICRDIVVIKKGVIDGFINSTFYILGEFNRGLAYSFIPKSIGILRDIFKYISLEDIPKPMEIIIDDIAEVLAVSDQWCPLKIKKAWLVHLFCWIIGFERNQYQQGGTSHAQTRNHILGTLETLSEISI